MGKKRSDRFDYWRVDAFLIDPRHSYQVYGIFCNKIKAGEENYVIGKSRDYADSWEEVKTIGLFKQERYTSISILGNSSSLLIGTNRGRFFIKDKSEVKSKDSWLYCLFWKGKRRYLTICLGTFVLKWVTCKLYHRYNKPQAKATFKLPDPIPIY